MPSSSAPPPQGFPSVFATQRGYGDWKGFWEFPGGKIESGETPQEALVREIWEELATQISVGELLATIEYDYPAFHLSMQCFACRKKRCFKSGVWKSYKHYGKAGILFDD